jgi:hypothetical protein
VGIDASFGVMRHSNDMLAASMRLKRKRASARVLRGVREAARASSAAAPGR